MNTMYSPICYHTKFSAINLEMRKQRVCIFTEDKNTSPNKLPVLNFVWYDIIVALKPGGVIFFSKKELPRGQLLLVKE